MGLSQGGVINLLTALIYISYIEKVLDTYGFFKAL